MFISEVVFDAVPPTTLDLALEAAGWLDVVEVQLDGAVVYRDEQGVANDIRPAIESIRALVHDHPAPYRLILGRTRESFHQLLEVDSNRLFVRWRLVSRDCLLDRLGDGEDWPAHRERVVAEVVRGGLETRMQWLDRNLADDVERAVAAGLHLRQAARPTAFEAGLDRCGPHDRWFESFSGVLPPAETERALLVGLTERSP